jgi:Tat protein translocase TatB subunit
MFGIGLTELIVIFVIGLLVLGPARLPELARGLGRGLKELQRTVQEMKEEIELESGWMDPKIEPSDPPPSRKEKES